MFATMVKSLIRRRLFNVDPGVEMNRENVEHRLQLPNRWYIVPSSDRSFQPNSKLWHLKRAGHEWLGLSQMLKSWTTSNVTSFEPQSPSSI
jgi:hypothetical protein